QYILQKVSQDVSLMDILRTNKGVEALSEFLDMSRAFTKTGQHRRQAKPPKYRPRGINNKMYD
ncbi:hypothetical protein EV361DRAFT_759381, partial [Lentinula raphanica]